MSTSQAADPATAADLLIVADRLFDGRAGHVGPGGHAVAIRDGRIIETGAAADLVARHPDAAVDRYEDATISPGLIDAHVHLTMPGDGSPYERGAGQPMEVRFLRARMNLRAHLEAGVTCVRDLGSHADFLDWDPDDAKFYPRLIRYGVPITAERGHMFLFGGGVASAAEARSAVERNLAAGADGVKIASSGGGTAGTIPHARTIDQEIVSSAVATAHDHGVLATTHALSLDTMRDAILAGTDGIEHLGFLDDNGTSQFSAELADLAIERGVTFGSTLGCNERFLSSELLSVEDPVEFREQGERTAYYISNADELRRRGARIAPASDAGWKYTHFGDFSNELRLMRLAGYSAVDVLHLATAFNASYLQIDDQVGTLDTGKVADIAVFSGNPLEDTADTQRTKAVYRQGVRSHFTPFV